MTMKLTLEAYKSLIKKDIKFLETCPDRLENDHIVAVLCDSIHTYYSKEPQAKEPKCSHFDCDCKPQAEEEGAKEFLKDRDVWIGTTVANQKAPEDYFDLTEMLESYASHKLTAVKEATIKLLESADCPICKDNSGTVATDINEHGEVTGTVACPWCYDKLMLLKQL